MQSVCLLSYLKFIFIHTWSILVFLACTSHIHIQIQNPVFGEAITSLTIEQLLFSDNLNRRLLPTKPQETSRSTFRYNQVNKSRDRYRKTYNRTFKEESHLYCVPKEQDLHRLRLYIQAQDSLEMQEDMLCTRQEYKQHYQ